MSLQPTLDSGVRRETAAVAYAAFPRGDAYRRLRDALGPIYADIQFARVGQPAACPWRLALITLLQFSENLSDRCAADAVRALIDWKYLLGLDLTNPGFDASVLSEFRSRLVAGGAEALLVRHPAYPLPRARPSGQAWPPAHRRDPYPRCGPEPQPPRLRD